MKKIIAFLTAAVMVICFDLSVTVMADGVYDADLQNKMNFLAKLQIIPEIYTEEELSAPVTRIEMAVAASGVMNAHAMSAGMGENVTFSDVKPLSVGADSVAFLNNCGIMVGHDGMFYPNNTILYEEAIKVMTSAAGYDSYAKANGGYPGGYLAAAIKMDILSSLSGGMGNPITHGDLVNLAYETLMADSMEMTAIAQNGFEYTIGESVLCAKFNAYEIEGVVNANSLSCLYDKTDDVSEDKMVIGSTVIKTDGADIDDYLGLPVIAYAARSSNGSEPVLLAIETDESMLKKIDIAHDEFDVLTTNGECRYFVDDKAKTAKLSATANVIYNERYAAKLYDCNSDLLEVKNGKLTLIDADSDGTYETIKILEPQILLLEGGNAVTEQLVGTDGTLIDVSADNRDRVVLECDGATVTSERIKRNTVAEVYESADKKLLTVIMTSKQISGKITMVDEKSIAVDNTEYSASEDFTKEISLNAEGTFFFDSTGRIVYMQSGASKGKHYAVVAGISTGGGISEEYKLKLFDDTGSMKILDFADKCTVDGKKTDVNADLYAVLSSGEYSIRRKLVRYEANDDGKIIWLDTLKPNAEYDKSELVENYANQSMVWKSKTSIFGESMVKVGDNTTIFAVPPEGSDDDRWRLVSVSEYTNDRNYTMSAYSLDDMLVAGAMVQYETVSTSGTPAYDNYWFIYEKTVQMLDSKGEAVTALKGWSEGSGGKTFIIPDYYKWDGAEYGDVFQLSVNSNSEIVGSRLCHRAEDEIFMRGNSIYGETVNGYIQTFGRIVRTNGTDVVIDVGNDEAPDLRVYDISIAKASYVIDRENEEIRKGTVADLSPNSLILIRDRSREPTEYAVIR